MKRGVQIHRIVILDSRIFKDPASFQYELKEVYKMLSQLEALQTNWLQSYASKYKEKSEAEKALRTEFFLADNYAQDYTQNMPFALIKCGVKDVPEMLVYLF
ncbi:MAG: hypothetical protein IPP69_11490 [Flavobacteriales bacterium]|nr:hypothetical protein [Flavobacteriales bacterium]